MLQKVSSEDVPSYTIRRLDQESSIPDTDQYKLTNIKEDALSNKLKYLDVLHCFQVVDLVSPIHVIFIVKLSNLVFSTRTGDMVRTTSTYSICYGRRRCVSSKQVCTTSSRVQDSMPCLWGSSFDRISCSDDEVEGNLSTIFQSVRGSKQYWFKRKSELLCMLRVSNMQDLWQEVSSHASIYSKLWSFGIRCVVSHRLSSGSTCLCHTAENAG